MEVSTALYSEMSAAVETRCFQLPAVTVEDTLLWERMQTLMEIVMR
jgi:hypothetical protein